jgi:hypothetical protein
LVRPARGEWSTHAGTGSTEGTTGSRELADILPNIYLCASKQERVIGGVGEH